MIFDLIAMQQEAAAVSTWTPADLFKNGEEGFWFDSSDFSTMFQDSIGSPPVTAAGQPVGLWKNKLTGQIANWDIRQGTSAFRPVLIGSSGKFALRFDGVDDWLEYVSSVRLQQDTINTSLAVGQTKAVNSTRIAMELSSGATNFYIQNRSDGSVLFEALGTVVHAGTLISNSSPNVIVGVTNNSTGSFLRVNGVQTSGNNSNKVTGAFRLAIPQQANVCDISQAVFINRVLTPAEITLLEAFIASKQ